LQDSSNAAAVLLQQQVGTGPVVRLVARLGVNDQPEVPSLALGSGLVTPLELTAAYAVFPALGIFSKPRGLVSVVSADGETVRNVHVERDRVLPEAVAFQMVSMLEDVVDRGTGARVRALGVRGTIGGKTGTTSDYRDAWFVGFSSSVVVGVWVGFDQPRTIGDGSTGARAALPIWADFMRRTARRLPSGPIAAPASLRPHELCRLSHQRPLDGCPVYTEYLKDGDAVPSGWCPLHPGSLRQRAERAIDGLVGSILRRIGVR
jgi:membrane carboxypeptidase/penicillin-binding protein